MTDLFLLSEAQMRRIERYFPLFTRDCAGERPADRERDCVCDQERTSLARRAAGVWAAQDDLQSVHSLEPLQDVFNKIFAALARTGGKPERIMIDATHLKAHRTAASLLKKGLFPTDRAHQRGSELQAARGLRQSRTPARHALERGADERLQGRGIDAAGHAESQAAPRRQGLRRRLVRAALAKRRIVACIPSKSNRKTAIPPCRPYKQRHKSKTCSAD